MKLPGLKLVPKEPTDAKTLDAAQAYLEHMTSTMNASPRVKAAYENAYCDVLLYGELMKETAKEIKAAMMEAVGL